MCVYSDLYNNLSINRKIIKTLGITVAAYWAVLLEVLQRVQEKKTYDPETGYFSLKRSYITDQIGFSSDDQIRCDQTLVKLGIVELDENDPDRMRISMQAMTSLIIEDDATMLASATKGIKAVAGKNDRSVYAIASLKKKLVETDPELRAKLEDWVEAAYHKCRLTGPAVKLFEEKLRGYSPDQAVRLKLVEIAITAGLSNFDWVAERYTKQMRSALGSSLFAGQNVTPTPVATKVKKDITF